MRNTSFASFCLLSYWKMTPRWLQDCPRKCFAKINGILLRILICNEPGSAHTFSFLRRLCLVFCAFFTLSFCTVVLSPWYNPTGWLGVKHQVTYGCSVHVLIALLTALHPLLLFCCCCCCCCFFSPFKIIFLFFIYFYFTVLFLFLLSFAVPFGCVVTLSRTGCPKGISSWTLILA